ncbi:hypothetical protein T492DRAFT_881139 [Pavlovales sp. CCMP2436]|nr:hypothetical protein T492DRAFT_881139 [Pavlovales sp. CCMP2436]
MPAWILISKITAACGLLKPTSAFALYRAHRTAAADVIAAVARGRQTRRTRDAERQSARTPRERAHGVRPDFSPPSTQRPGAWAHASTAERVARAARFGAGAQFASGATSPVEAELEGEPAGTVHGEGGEAASSAAATLCPICCETRADVEQLPHWEARGDVSAHRMCAVCRASYTANTCPFCKEVLAKEELLAHISNFIDVVSSRARIADPDPNELAALLERWQTFEMELDAQPFVLRRVTQLIVEDTAFSSRLAQGVQLRASWLRDTAGVLFRFHALAADGELRLRAPGSAALLAEAVETLLEPFERDPPAPMHGHYYGALYSQALVPWLCAWRSGTSTRTAAALVMRVGHAIVRAQHTYGSRRELRGYVRARMHLEYVQLAHEPVWGGKERDIVWQTFWTEA